MLNIKNKNLKNFYYNYKRKINIALYSIVILLIGLTIYNRQLILVTMGDKLFGGWTYDIDWAETFYRLADKSDDNKVLWLNYQLARINFIKGNLDKAIEYSELEIKYRPENCKSYYIRGLSYGYMDDLDDAIRDFERYNSCIPLTWAGHNDLAWFWFRKGDMQQVVNVIENVNLIYPYNPWLQNTYGTALMNLKRYDEAETALNNALLGAEAMTPEDWGRAYPGNDPTIYGEGLENMKKSIKNNLKILSTYNNN